MGMFDGWFDANPNRDDGDLTVRERRALFAENVDPGPEAAIEERCLEAWWRL